MNVVAYRLVRGQSLVSPGSRCVHCKHSLRWFELVPVFSWLGLGGRCRYCKKPISWLYPFIELLTALIFFLLFVMVQPLYVPAYIVFCSALIVTIRSDSETMLISRYVSTFLIPLGILLSFFGLLPITGWESIIGVILGYSFLFLMAQAFYVLSGKQGIGQGDLELLAFIGSFTGVYGVWMSLLLGSITGSVYGIAIMIYKAKYASSKIPFGPFLAIGAVTYILVQDKLFNFVMNYIPSLS